jgi:transcriptional regulator with XRE-family HTH domain
MDALTLTFARNLRGLRLAADLPQERVAELTGLTKSYVSLLENGLRSPPLATLAKLASVFNVSPGYLLQELDLPDEDPNLRFAAERTRAR